MRDLNTVRPSETINMNRLDRNENEIDGIEDDVENQEEELDDKMECEPCKPSAKERARHNITHTPYRVWCDHCVWGKQRADRGLKCWRAEWLRVRRAEESKA